MDGITETALPRVSSCPNFRGLPESLKEQEATPTSDAKETQVFEKSLSEQWKNWGTARKSLFTCERVLVRGLVYSTALVIVGASAKIAAIIVIADVSLSFSSKASYRGFFSTDKSPSHFFHKINESFWFYAKINLISEIAQLVFFCVVPFKQNIQVVDLTHMENESGLENADQRRFFRLVYTVLSSTLVPIVEEYVFRGILHEKIREVQSFITPNYDAPLQKVIRNISQGIIFGGMHWEEEQGVYNYIITADCAVFGTAIGFLNEKHHSLIPGLFMHALNNLLSFSSEMIKMEN